MSLPEQLGMELNNLEAQGALVSPQQIAISGDNYQFVCELNALGTLGCALSHMTVCGDKLATASLDELKQVSELLASKLTYLLEPVATIEVDPEGCTVQMRSDPPHRERDGNVYYELLVRPGEVTLRRYRTEQRQPREAVAAHLTREVLVRLADDLVAVVC
ncbi:MAG: hypothetical protein WBF93_01830 [Pirellulales bacterium]|nr:hypothetical protein [Pirellulales bacterium]